MSRRGVVLDETTFILLFPPGMRHKLEDLSPEKRAAVQAFKSDITSVFNDLYEEKWDQERWDRAVGKRFSSDPSDRPQCPSRVYLD